MRIKQSFIQKDKKWGYIFIAPWVMGFVAFILIPFVSSLIMSFYKWDLFSEPIPVGLSNYSEVLTSKTFHIALSNTLIFATFSTFISVVFGVITAWVLAENKRINLTLRTLLYMPCLVIGLAFSMMMSPVFGTGEFGLINQLFSLLNLPQQTWLAIKGQAVFVMVAFTFWNIGSPMLVFIAGLKSIDKAYYEAAQIDGASNFMVFRKISLPLLTPMIIYQSIMGVIFGMQIFDIAIGLAQSGGSASIMGMGINNSLATLVYYLYNVGFKEYNMGLASAIGWVIFLLTGFISISILFLNKKTKMFSAD
jgi:multiple sugar transport system permease protein